MTSGADVGDTDVLSGRMRSARAQWALVALGQPRLPGLCQPARVLPEAHLTKCPPAAELPTPPPPCRVMHDPAMSATLGAWAAPRALPPRPNQAPGPAVGGLCWPARSWRQERS